MKIVIYLVIAAMFIVPSSFVHGQNIDESRNLATIFGRAVNGKCDVFEFNSKYHVKVNRREDNQISEIELYRWNEDFRDAKLSNEEIEDFFRKANSVKHIGRQISQGTLSSTRLSRPAFWDIYENAFIRRFERITDTEMHTVGLIVFYPHKVTGKVKEVSYSVIGEKKYMTNIIINDCSYFTFNDTVHAGDEGEYLVVGPNNLIDGKCVEIKINPGFKISTK